MYTTLIIFVLKANKVLYLQPNTADARVAELVDALDSKSSSFGSAGSIPASGTKKEAFSQKSPFLFLNSDPLSNYLLSWFKIRIMRLLFIFNFVDCLNGF